MIIDPSVLLSGIAGDKDLLDHPGLAPPAIRVRAICELLWLLEPN